MKHLSTLAVLWLLTACSTQEKNTLSSTSNNQAKAVPVEAESASKLSFVAHQKNDMPVMLGAWLVHTMQRQIAMPEETLYLSLHLNNDQTYSINTPCGDMKGQFMVKGMSIKFLNATYDANRCGDTEKLDEMARLLKHSVSLYAFNGNMLFLKDGAGNNVFRATR